MLRRLSTSIVLSLGACAGPSPSPSALPSSETGASSHVVDVTDARRDGRPSEPASIAQDPPPVLSPQQDPTSRDAHLARPSDPNWDGVMLISGEWLFGEITEMRDDVLVFDSDRLDEVSLDWSDVAEVHSAGPMMVLLQDTESVNGTLDIRDGRAILRTVDGDRRELGRDAVVGFVPGRDREADYWSGGFGLGVVGRAGNVDQFDSSLRANLKRETAGTRGRGEYTGTVSEANGTEIANNRRAIGEFDVFLSDRLFVRPVSLEFYQDRIQGIRYRITPGAGLGYDVIESATVDWHVTVGAGWQRTRFDGVREDGSNSLETAVAFSSTRLEWDITDDVEFDLTWQIQSGFQADGNVNQNLRALLSVDLFADLDLDVGLQWDRVGNPAPLPNGTQPENDDYRMTVGLGWDF